MSGRTLGDAVWEQLSRTAGGTAEAEYDGLRARVEVEGSGPYGADVRGLTVDRVQPGPEASAGARTARAATRLSDSVRYLGEPLEAQEVDTRSARAVLRTRRDRVLGGEFDEIEVAGGDRIDVRRFRVDPATGGRVRIAANHGRAVAKRLVDDLADALREDRGAG